MEAILVKVFATALALSLVMTRPDAVKTQFDPATDKAEVLAVLGAGCDAMRKSFDIENIDLDGLIDTVMIDKQAAAGEIAGFKGIKFDDLHLAYKQLCKHEKIDREVIDVGQVIEFYNRAAADLPDHNRLKGLKLPGMTTVLDGTGAKFAELFEPDSRRHWVPLAEIPEFVQKAFVAAEDKRFFEHKGVDVRSVTRAFMTTMGGDKRQGGSTITQQVAKNLLVGDSVTFERKIREVIVASRIEKDAHQAGNPRNLSQLDLSRPLVMGHRPRGARLFRQAGEGPDAGRRRVHRRPDQGTGLLQSGPLPRPRA